MLMGYVEGIVNISFVIAVYTVLGEVGTFPCCADVASVRCASERVILSGGTMYNCCCVLATEGMYILLSDLLIC